MNFFLLLYNIIVVPSLWTIFHLGAFINRKIRRGVEGRRDLFTTLSLQLEKLSGRKRVWFHASSLGEFEQAKPIIAEVVRQMPGTDIIATFFSPSGLENSRNYKLAGVITYLPFDSMTNVHRFIELVRPDVAVMVRYDIWPNLVDEVRRRAIPLFIANATMKEDSPRFFPLLVPFHRWLYDRFTHILTVSENDRAAFERFGLQGPHLEAIGDTRFDQVMKRSIDARTKKVLAPEIVKDRTVFIVGQSWPEDDEVIIPVLKKLSERHPSLLTIIVPHEPTEEHLDQLEESLGNGVRHIRFSELNHYDGEPVIVVDGIGILVALYSYAHVVYIGGSFRQGIHNVLEPAVFGLPVIYGPKHTNSQEAVTLAHLGGGMVVHNSRDLYRTLSTMLTDEEQRSEAGAISAQFVSENCGATERFLHHLLPLLER